MESSQQQQLRLRRTVWAVVISALLATIISPQAARACDECDLQDAFNVILGQSSETTSDHHSHISALDDRAALARAVDKALNSLKGISESANFTENVYRRFDGLGNNLKNPFWGASLHTERRLLNNSYDDGAEIPRYRSVTGNVLPSAREVSMNCFLPDDNTNNWDPVFSQMHMQFGQFLDHDIVLTELEIASNCCADMSPDGTHPNMFEGKFCFPIKVGDNDRFFTVPCLTARRSLGVQVNGVREQINGVSSYVDASQVYGPAKLLSDELRTFVGGRMKTTETTSRGEVVREDLPQLGVFKCRKTTIDHCPHAGDPRVNVFPGLTTIHTAFHLEHNRIAGELAKQNPNWDDEMLFQEARKIVIAITQKITYDEYLPKIIGPHMMDILGLNDPFEYDDSIDAGVTSVFGAAAFRFGHSQINGPLKITKTRSPGLSEIFFRPEVMLEETGGVMKNIIIHQAKQGCQRTDILFSPEILDKLFLNVDAPGESFDLPALAVHRSRDHGLPSYLDYVNLVTNYLSEHADKEQLVSSLNLPRCLLDGTYESYRDIDLFAGAMYETHVKGGIVGPVFAFLIGEQFQRLRAGDRFFYETSDTTIGFTSAQLQEIKLKTSLSNVFCKNNEKLGSIQPLAMERRSSENAKQSCDSFGDIDFSLWREES